MELLSVFVCLLKKERMARKREMGKSLRVGWIKDTIYQREIV